MHCHVLDFDDRVGAIPDRESVIAVKNAVLTGMWVLIPTMAATGGSGFTLARTRGGRLVDVKRMRVVAPMACSYCCPARTCSPPWANAGRFDRAFYALQGVELVAGAINITLLVLNMRDGLRLAGRLSARRPVQAASR